MVLPELSRRETDVIRLNVDGKANKEIAHEFGLAESTVKSHVEAILRRLEAANRTDATVKWLALGHQRPGT